MALAPHKKHHMHGSHGVHNTKTANGGSIQSGTQATASIDPRVKNKMDRGRVLSAAKDMLQLNNSTTYSNPTLANSNVINFTPKNIGLLKRFYVEVTVTGTTGSGTTLALAPFGPANIFSNITFIDFQNQSRINTTGWHLIMVNTFRAGSSSPLASAETSDTPLGYVNVLGGISAPATVAASTAWTVKMIFEVPICYADGDLRGSIYMATTGANTSLLLTLNPSFFVLNTADPTNAVFTYTGTAPTITSMTTNIYQNYLDQLPLDGGTGKVILPANDLNTIYQLQYTNQSGFTAGNQLAIPYANLRQFLSTVLVYDNAGVLNPGTDITSFGLQVANNTFIWQYDVLLTSYLTRKRINSDTPKGSYYFDHRRDPINTDQFGNTQFVFVPSAVTAGAVLYLGYEFFSSRQTIMRSEALPAG